RFSRDWSSDVCSSDLVVVQIERAVEGGLPAHRRQDRVGLLLLDDLFDHLPGDRLDVGDVRRLRVRHDRRRIAVHQDDLEAFLAQRLALLRTRIVEFAGLADDDRPGANDQDALEVGSLWHFRFPTHSESWRRIDQTRHIEETRAIFQRPPRIRLGRAADDAPWGEAPKALRGEFIASSIRRNGRTDSRYRAGP